MTTPVQRALVVDDEPGIRLFVSACLEMLGFECTEASSGEAAIAEADDRRFDVIFMDVNMPGMGGMKAIHDLREMGVQSKIIVLSGVAGPEVDGTHIGVLGADGFLAKPCTIKDVQHSAMNAGAVPA